MNQLDLFEKEKKLDIQINKVVNHIKRTGRLHQFLKTRIRSLDKTSTNKRTDVLRHLEDVENTVRYILLTLDEISPNNGLKTSISKIMETYFDSHIKDENLIEVVSIREIRKIGNDIATKYRISYLSVAGISQYIPRLDDLDSFEEKIDELYESLMKKVIYLEHLLRK